MDEKALSYKNILYYEVKLDNGVMYTLDRETFYNSKDEIKEIINVIRNR